MQTKRFTLDVSAEKIHSYYTGTVRFVHVKTDDGSTLQFPVSELQKFVGHNGVQGRFEIQFNDQHKLVRLNRV